MKTFHASPERSSKQALENQHTSLGENSFLSELINALPYVVTILNSNREVVFSNQSLIDTLKVNDFREFLGKRPGEALNCIHSHDMEGGCGTSENCRVCGAVNTITASIRENRKVVNECRITSDINGAEEYYDFEVTATPFSWQGQKYTIFALADISGVKRKRMLERIFFHDIMNTAGNLKGLSELITRLEDAKKKNELMDLLVNISNELVDDIQEQRQLSAAETGDLKINYSTLNTGEILSNAIIPFKNQEKSPVFFLIPKESENINFSSDKSLLSRILINMLKNAMEASEPGETITVKANLLDETLRFTVHNPKLIPRNIQLQIFKRSFSTKDKDRGLGTYSMKLLGERYLKGKVHFRSEDGLGTEFYFDLPLNHE